MEKKYPIPPFTEETAKQKIQLAEDAWNSKNPEKIENGVIVRNLSMEEPQSSLFCKVNGKRN